MVEPEVVRDNGFLVFGPERVLLREVSTHQTMVVLGLMANIVNPLPNKTLHTEYGKLDLALLIRFHLKERETLDLLGLQTG